jgi:uncharacterized protein
MKPHPMYYHLAEGSRTEQEAVVALLSSEPVVEAIFLLGCTVLSRRTESLFTTSSATASRCGQLFLLVLVQTADEHRQACLQDKLEKRAETVVPATLLLLDRERFNAWLSAGHPWAVCVRERSVLLFDRGTVPFPQPGIVDEEALQKEQAILFRRSRTRVAEFLAGAELFRLRRQGAMAAFMLHQAAEQCLHTLVKTGTGYSPNTHSLDRLLRYAALVSCRVLDLFPQQTERDKRLFRLLRIAYIDTRYNDYSISEDDLDTLARRVQTLRELVAGFGEKLFSSQPATTPNENQ